MMRTTETLIEAARSNATPNPVVMHEIAERLESQYAALVGIRTAIGMYDLGAAHRIVLAELGV